MKPKLNKSGDVIEHPKLGAGYWIVVATQLAGGSSGEGMSGHESWDDGHELVLRRLVRGYERYWNAIDWAVKEKRFYQSGSFVDSVMLPYVKPLRQLGKKKD